ncbi:MAG: ester cyclase [Bacteroidales bacterium]
MGTKFRYRCFSIIIFILFYSNPIPFFGQNNTLINNKKVIIRYIDVVINDHNLSRKGEFFSSDYVLHTMEGKDVRSTQDSLHNSMLGWLFKAIPDVHYNIDNIVAGGDMVGVNTTATGTARCEMFGLPAAQKKVRYNQMFIYLLKDGKIIDQWEVIDPEGLKAQLEAK